MFLWKLKFFLFESLKLSQNIIKKFMLKVENLNEHIFENLLWECYKQTNILRYIWFMWRMKKKHTVFGLFKNKIFDNFLKAFFKKSL